MYYWQAIPLQIPNKDPDDRILSWYLSAFDREVIEVKEQMCYYRLNFEIIYGYGENLIEFNGLKMWCVSEFFRSG